jgi:hypothetical protein
MNLEGLARRGRTELAVYIADILLEQRRVVELVMVMISTTTY